MCVVSVFGSKERPTCRNGIFGVLLGAKNGTRAKKRKIGAVILCSPTLNRTETLATQARTAHSNRLPDLPFLLSCVYYAFSDKPTAESLVLLNLPNTLRGISRPSDVVRPV